MPQNKYLKKLLNEASGPIAFTFTNDYMFRACLQENNLVLKALVSSLLHLDIHEIQEITIMNPIELGAAVDDKDFILDIQLLLDGCQCIDLEMQVANRYNWPERSISYTARSYDNLKAGKNYLNVRPVINIGFLDYTLFPDAPEFYSRNLLMNIKNHRIYSDKFDIRVVDLTCIHLATDEDRTYYIDYWARLFKATTWEEVHMITENNAYCKEAAETLYKMNADDMVRQRCLARRDFEWEQERNRQIQEKLQEELADTKTALANTKTALADTKTTLADKEAELREKDALIAELQKTLFKR